MAVPVEAAALFLDLLGARDRAGALALARSLLAGGASTAEVIDDILSVAQRGVGERWETGEWTVSQEHAATAIVEAVLASLAPTERTAEWKGALVLACCEQEWHSVPARMLAELLRGHGWVVTFLGASVSADDLGGTLRLAEPVALLVSCSVSMNLLGAARVIDAAHAVGYRVLVGGSALPTAARASALGADGWASSVDDADQVLTAWSGHRGVPSPVARPGSAAATALASCRAALVDETLAVLRSTTPVMAGFTERQLGRARTDLGYIVSFGAASVLIGDDEVFHEFLEWLDPTLFRLGLQGFLAASLDTMAGLAGAHAAFLPLLDAGSDRLRGGLVGS